jgi:transposase-like protein
MKKRSISERRKLIRMFRGSGMSALEFSRKHGIHFTTLYSWMRGEKPVKGSGSLRRVKIEGSALIGVGEPVVAEVVLANGARVRLMRGSSEEELSMILKALGPCGN